MKHIFILLYLSVLFIGCNIIESKKYFFIAYSAMPENSSVAGNYTYRGQMVSYDSLKIMALSYIKCSYPSCKINDVVISGIYEFKNETEMDILFPSDTTYNINPCK